ncbi:MAG: MBL fold metallo-hydrolase [Ferruginibacter sp.]
MQFEQIYTGCLTHAAYYLESNGEAAIFDPLGDTGTYIERAHNDFSRIKYVFQTDLHADSMSGHLDLIKKTGAKIVFGPTADPVYEAIIAEDNEVFRVGNVSVKVLHTPGHKMESTTYLITDENGTGFGIVTGELLLIGDVGRPDPCRGSSPGLTRQKLAGCLYDSLRNKIMPMNDGLVIYPNHGAGMACGKRMSKEIFDTLGHQKKVNYALKPALTKSEFIKLINCGEEIGH